jgi:hypothetical protein
MDNINRSKAKRMADIFRDTPLPKSNIPQQPIQDDAYDSAYKRMLENAPDPIEQKRQEIQAQNAELMRQKERLSNIQPPQAAPGGMSGDIDDGMETSPYVGGTPAFENLRKKLLNR